MYSDRLLSNYKRTVASRLGQRKSTLQTDTISSGDGSYPYSNAIPEKQFNLLDSNPYQWSPTVIPIVQNSNQNSRVVTQTSIQTDNAQEEDEDDDEHEITPAEVSLMRKVLRTQLVESCHEVEILRRDANSPLHSVKTFEQLNLRPELLKGVYEMGFNAPSKIQETTLPTLIADPPSNMIAQSQSGTGKTAAFVLSCLTRVCVHQPYPQVLILSPTNELAHQTGQVAKQMGQYCTGIEFRYAVKGEILQKGEQIREQVVIGTPGKVWDWSRRRHLNLCLLTCFVLDEADIMISLQGHLDQCLEIHRHISPTCQTMLFSATYAQDVMEFAEMIIRNPIIIRLKREEETLRNVKQYYIECYSIGQKYVSICNIYGVLSIGQAIIFCRTKKTASWLGSKLSEDGHSVGYLSSDLEIKDRMKTLQRFRDGEEKVLITTNVCARGIDVEQVTIVINFDLPVTVSKEADCETYLHRIGRSGRFGRRGIAINFVADDRDMEVIRAIELHFGRRIKRLDATDVDELEDLGAP